MRISRRRLDLAAPARARAFTLMELAVSLAMMGLTAIAATMLFSLYLNITKKTKLETHLRQRAETTLEYLVNETRMAGGQGALSSASVFVENDCTAARGFPDCDRTDRITMVQPLVGYGKCKIVSDSGGSVEVNTIRPSRLSPAECCLKASFTTRQVAIVKNDVVTPALLTRVGGCSFRYVPILGSVGGKDGASLLMADVKTFYREPGRAPGEAGRLAMQMELNGDGSVVGERLFLSNDILDFQARLSGPTLGLSVVAGRAHEAGAASIETAFSTTRALARPFIAREATARLSLRDAR